MLNNKAMSKAMAPSVSHQVAQPKWAISAGPSNMAVAVPVGMKVPQKPMAVLRRSGATKLRNKAGAGTMTIKIAAPSIARINSSCGALVVSPASPLNRPSNTSPHSTLRRRPNPSANMPTNTAVSMPAICDNESNQPACTKLTSSCARRIGMAGATLPTCMAATMPASTTNTAGHSGWVASVVFVIR